MDLHARARSLCSRDHGGGSDWLPGAGLVDLPDHPLHLHLALPALLLEVPRDALLSDGQGPLQGRPETAGQDRPLQRPGVPPEGRGPAGAGGEGEQQSSAGAGGRGAAGEESVHPGSV